LLSELDRVADQRPAAFVGVQAVRLGADGGGYPEGSDVVAIVPV
jgi:hypothetical protein